jgi:hypothetical protein
LWAGMKRRFGLLGLGLIGANLRPNEILFS